jgi:hypothetical protein
VAQIKSALVQTADPVHGVGGTEVPVTREGGGVVDLPKADNPLLFASPTAVAFGELQPGASGPRAVELADAGGGAGDWTVAVSPQNGDSQVTAPPTVTVPGTLTLTAVAGATAGDVTGFVVLTRGSDVRRIPYWLAVSSPKLGTEPATPLPAGRVVSATTAGGPAGVSRYRYPTGGDVEYPGPERVYRLTIRGAPANAGVVVLSGRAVPHITFAGDEDHLVGYAGLPVDLNPYRRSYGTRRKIAGVVLPTPGAYDLVFDTRSVADAGPFTFRWWVNDTAPPSLRLRSTRGGVLVAAADAGAGVDPDSIAATLDGRSVKAVWRGGTIRLAARPGRHRLVLQVADYQEAKNMEDVLPAGGRSSVLPNTATLRAAVTVTAR